MDEYFRYLYCIGSKSNINYEGSYYLSEYLSLQLKIKYGCGFYGFEEDTNNYRHAIDLSFILKNPDKKIKYIQNINDTISYYFKSYNIVPIEIRYNTNDNMAHTCMFIYRQNNNSIEIYDPSKNNPHLVKFAQEIFPNINIISSEIIHNGCQGLQKIEFKYNKNNNSGFCLAWSYLFANIILKFPNLSSNYILKQMNNKLSISLKYYVIGFITDLNINLYDLNCDYINKLINDYNQIKK